MKLEDFLSNKRYTSVAAIVIIFMIILIICAVRSHGSGAESTEEASEVVATEITGELPESTDEELITLIKDYFEAYASDDIESLETIAQPLTDNEKSYIGAYADYYEEYQNITVYSMPGATEDSYLVSVVYELKFYEIKTPAPGMEFFYVERDGKGNLIVNNVYSLYNTSVNREQAMDDEIYAMMCAYEQSESVTALQTKVQSDYDEALKSDESLANMVGNGTLRDVYTTWHASISETTEGTEIAKEDTETEQVKEQTTEDKSKEVESTESEEKDKSEKEEKKSTDSGKVKTKDICKVRKGPGTDYEVLGMVTAGVKLKKLGTEGDWTKVEFQGETGYIKTSLLKTVKKS